MLFFVFYNMGCVILIFLKKICRDSVVTFSDYVLFFVFDNVAHIILIFLKKIPRDSVVTSRDLHGVFRFR